jgi:threonine synthase
VRCAECSAAADLPAYRCTRCGGPLVAHPAPIGPDDLREDRSRAGVWRRSGMLPRTANAVTLGEGGTTLLPLTGLLEERVRVHAKVEALNPTLSFKDRAMALASSVALDLGLPGLVLASTGNAAVSAAAYAAAAGLPCRVVCGTESEAGLKLAAT